MKLTLRTQLILTGLLTVAVTVVSVSLLMQAQVRSTLTAQVQQRGESIARYLVAISSDYLLAKDKLALANFAEGAMKNDGVAYVQIIDSQKIIWAARPAEGEGGIYYPPGGIGDLGSESGPVQRYYNGQQWIQDIGFFYRSEFKKRLVMFMWVWMSRLLMKLFRITSNG